MTGEAILVLAILVGTVALFVSEKYPLDLVAMIGLGALLIFGLVTPEEGFSGFSNPATLTVAAMFILSAGLQKPAPRPRWDGSWCVTAEATTQPWL